jgi:hypothetical protein
MILWKVLYRNGGLVPRKWTRGVADSSIGAVSMC